MSFNPQNEDYQRLWLRYARLLDGTGQAAPAGNDADQAASACNVASQTASVPDEATFHATKAFSDFSRKYAQDCDSLPQTDSDRAFHLVSQAAYLVDYKAPFVMPNYYAELMNRARQLLDEAVTLDPSCHDAQRMREALPLRSFEAYYTFLSSNAGQVKADYLQARKEIEHSDQNPDRMRLELDLAQRPYLRWLASWSEQALICGRNREALRIAHEAFELDPRDKADLRFTAALAAAKLEDELALEQLESRTEIPGCTRPADDAWLLLARTGMAFKQGNFDEANRFLQRLQEYPLAPEVLIRQAEIPDGCFARVAVAPYSEDELILACSEGSVLLQEGLEESGRGALSDWIAHTCALKHPRAAYAVMQEQMRSASSSQYPTDGAAGGPSGSDGPFGPGSPSGPGNPFGPTSSGNPFGPGNPTSSGNPADPTNPHNPSNPQGGKR